MKNKNDELSALQKFRLSPVYLAVMKAVGKTKPLVSSAEQIPANLLEKAKTWINKSNDSFSNALIAKLIQAGLNRAIVDVMAEGSAAATVFMADRLGRLSKEIPNMLAEIAEAELVERPDDNHHGLFVYEVRGKQGVDFDQFLQNLLAKQAKNESEDPCFTPGKIAFD